MGVIMGFELIPYPNAEELARAVAGRWLDELAKRKDPKVPYSVALSGGRIARDFFTAVAQQATSRGITMDGVHFFWADERCVPPTDPESNYAVARQLLFEPLKIPAAQIHRVRGEEEEGLALRDAVENVLRVAPVAEGKGLPVLNMIFLGMGEDGHVASLFPGESAETMANPAIYRSVIAVKPPPRRITLGYGMIAAAREVWLLASGKGKEQALRESLAPQGKTPLARVLRSRVLTRIFSDVGPV
ncbi:MAG: pgl [Pedosphaera sp.]|nr:pgl [Pedosphaera sp.]